LKKNLEYNKVTNIESFHLGVTSDGRDITITQSEDNSGASSQFFNESVPHGKTSVVGSTVLRNILIPNFKVKILKIDCEGSEYEILKDSLHLLENVEYVMGELHHVPNSEFNAYILYDKISAIVGQDNNKLTIIQTNTIKTENPRSL